MAQKVRLAPGFQLIILHTRAGRIFIYLGLFSGIRQQGKYKGNLHTTWDLNFTSVPGTCATVRHNWRSTGKIPGNQLVFLF